MNEQDIKALTPTMCPHCGEQLIVEFMTSAPRLTGIYTVEMIESAKESAIKKIEELQVPEDVLPDDHRVVDQ